MEFVRLIQQICFHIAGSCLNRKHSEESKAKMRASWAARKGIPKKNVSDETKRKISESKIGKKRKPFTDKTIKNMSLSKIGNKNRLGIPHTQEAKNKMKGRVPVKLSPEILEKIRLKHVGAVKMLSSAFQAIDKSAQKGVIKKNTAARRKSRLSKLVK